MPRIAILGIGNVLMGDDAFGPHVIKLLEARYRFPEHVAVVEAGTPGLDLTVHLDGLEALVVVDTLEAAAAPGEIRVLDKTELLEKRPVQAMNLHEPGLREALLTLEFSGGGPREVRLVGIVPERVDTGVGLSPAVRAGVPRALAEALAQLTELGVEPERRDPPAEPDLWWERGSEMGPGGSPGDG
jgi:hydrogenase maturation protease